MKKIICSAIFVLTCVPAGATKTVSLNGPVAPCRLTRILDEMQSAYDAGERRFVLLLNSNGGDLGAAMAFIDAVKAMPGIFLATRVYSSSGECSSACFPILASGDSRSANIGASFYVHGLDWHSEHAPRLFAVMSVSNDCPLGRNRYRNDDGGPDLELAANEYLAAVAHGGQELADYIEPLIRGPAHRGKTLSTHQIRGLSPGFLE